MIEREDFNVFACGPVDPSHTIWYGLIINIRQLFRTRVFNPDTRLRFDRRLLLYPWPRGTSHITFNLGSANLKRWSVEIYKHIALILLALLWKRVDHDDFELILDGMELVHFYTSPAITLQPARHAQQASHIIKRIIVVFRFV